jgi:hypothetical protein
MPKGESKKDRQYIILTNSQTFFSVKEQCCVLCGELENTNFIVFDLTRGWIKPMICDETEFPP